MARMEDVLDLYHEEYDRERPVVWKTSKQLTGDVRRPIKAAPGRVERYDTEYQRNGSKFMFCEPKGWSMSKCGRRTAVDFAQQMKWLVDEAYPEATVSGWCWTISTPTSWARSTKHLNPPRRVA